MPAKTIDKLPEPRKDPPAPARAVPAVAPRPAAMAAPAAAIAPPSTVPSNGVAAHRSASAAASAAAPTASLASPAVPAAAASARSAHLTAATSGAQHGPHAASPAASPQPRRGSAPRPTSAIELQGSAQFTPGAWTEYIQSCPGWADVDVKWGTLAPATPIAIQCDRGASTYSTKHHQPLPIAQPFFAGLPDALAPALFVTIDKNVITGFAASSASGKAAELATALVTPETLSALGLARFQIPSSKFNNAIRDGHFVFGADALTFTIAGWLSGALTLGLEDDKVSFDATAHLAVRGLPAVDLHIARDKDGHFTGELQIPVALGRASGNVLARYVNGDVSIAGTIGYASDKLNGSLTVLFGDVHEVHQAARGQIDPSKLLAEDAVHDDATAEKTKKDEKGIGAYGQFAFAFTDWMTGTVLGILDPFGHVTTVGKIAPPKEIVLLKATPPIKRSIPPFPLGASARYGLPYVADVHIGFEFDLGFSAGIGPAVLTDIVVEGTYSTDPTIAQDFSLSGAFRISAYAALQLGFSVFAGVTILGHDINAGGTITGSAGIKAYAEARPKIGYRETADPLAGKKGEAYLQGHLEAAAQPVLGLSGEAWIKLSAPWWSPVSDHTWPIPLFNYEWPLASSLGVAADIDYVIGSGKLPDVKLGQVDFDASKFSDALLGGDIPPGKGSGDPEKAGTWAGVAPKPPATPATAPPKGPAPAGGGKAHAGTPSNKTGRARQTPEQAANVPKTPDASRRWLEGMQALAQLHERAEHDPEDAGEIHTHLAAIQKRFGFTRLEPTLEGDYWVIDAELNPRKPKKGPDRTKEVVVRAAKKATEARATTERDAKKPAHDKHGPDDKAGAAPPPKHDDRDPQKVKDDAKAPRNHQHAKFPYQVGPPQAPTKVARVGGAKTYLRPIPVPPMKSPDDRWPGYVINMAAIPSEVQPGMVVRYAEGAWHDGDEKAMGAKRTGVVVGVNTRERLDAKADGNDKERVGNAVKSIQDQDSAGNHITMAAFGFAWEPNWINKATHARAPISEVRAAYQKLEGEDKVAAGNLDKVNARTLPYGIFREEVIGSDYTRTATSLISAIADPVHILSQDADGKVIAASGKGVLAEYDAVLRAMDRQPMLVIGGYNFDHFEWDAHDPQRKQQLTRLANELDRAIRAAIAKLYPDMLYPSEPNTLMKATDERDGGGIFQDPQHLHDLEAAHAGADGDRMGAFYGLGQNEGRNAMLRRREIAGDTFTMDYRPSASTTTSPLPNNDARGLVRHSGMIYDAADGTIVQDGQALTSRERKHPHTGITTQSQSFANPRTQAREFDKTTPVVSSMPPMSPKEEKQFRDEHRQALQDVFSAGEAAQRDLVANPGLSADSREMQRHRSRVDKVVADANSVPGPASHAAAQRAIQKAGELCKELINAMSSGEFRSLWQRLQELLNQVMQERPPQGGRR